MAHTSHTVPRTGPLGPASFVIAVLLVLLTAWFHPFSYGGPHQSAPESAVLVTGVQADGPRADDGPCVVPAPTRVCRDVPDDRPAAPLTAAPVSHDLRSAPQRSAYGPTQAAHLPRHPHLVGRHRDRAPPPLPGT